MADEYRELKESQDAERLMQDEAFKKAISDQRQAILDRFAETPVRDTEGLLMLRLMLKLLDDLVANLRTTIEQGQMAALTIEEEKRRKRGIFR